MAYKILYIEDNDPSTTIAGLSEYGLEIIHHDPSKFELAMEEIKAQKIDLLLLDFTLSAKQAMYDAPTIAQTIRTQHNTLHKKDLPIILISSDDNISAYYQDYTSQDLFDYSIPKVELLSDLEKYTTRIKSLITNYPRIFQVNSDGTKLLVELLNVPEDISNKLSIRIREQLETDKFTKSTFLASDFIINHIVKPSGILIGEEILAARLGIDTRSKDWGALKILLDDYKYKGIYSDCYERWWSVGIELWWKTISPKNPSLKRLKASDRTNILREVLGLDDLQEAQKSERSTSDYFWTICYKKKTPLDPIDGFEISNNIEPWEDKKYYSLLGASELASPKVLTTIARKRYLDETA